MDANEPTLFELDHGGEGRDWLPRSGGEEKAIDDLLPGESLRREPLNVPIVSEPEVVRHFTRLSRRNFCIDSGFYPLGSCTMKYNPKINDALAALPGFSQLHPEAGMEASQGTLRILYEMQTYLAALTGLSGAALNPCAGAHGELCGMMMIRAYHQDQGDKRTTVLVPDSAHGTNPASAAMAGFKIAELKSGPDGCVDIEELKRYLNEETAALMLTNPNTLGLFEKNILEIEKLVHDAGALLYYDGANLNAISGVARPGDMGFNVVHINLHKTFSTPHGGGGPGSGPVAVCEKLKPYLPVPLIEKENGQYIIVRDSEKSIGQLSTFFGNVGVILRAYVYMRMLGLEGIRKNSVTAVLNARYLQSRLKDLIPSEHDGDCMHEFVLTLKDHDRFGDLNVMAMAKNLIDRGFHAPTVYFPLIVKEALMIEPTETESKRTLDAFAEAVASIFEEYQTDPERVLHAPHETPVRKLDEVKAARQPDLAYQE
ncbi:MAG: aminomethyl-transferring glycine dehydrogenase subunit GcvPB [Candidatus Omnitrophica bacterium]|nr:aminomethyl-transferring glycine dehydrogenase subunit GcvPB [Candidatus Omnitrophota bacterium]